jgi:hypothetical protein
LSSREQPLTLAELIDLEGRLLADRELSPDDLLARDRSLAPRLLATTATGAPPGRAEVLRRWLTELGSADRASVGARIQALYRLVALVLVAAALVSGAGTAAALLSYDGSQPVNLLRFLAVLVVIPAVLAVFAVIRMLPHRWVRWLPGFGLVHELVRQLSYERAAWEAQLLRAKGAAAHLAQALARLGSWSTLYAEVERWLLMTLTQGVALGFQLGSLAMTLYLVTATDLAFAWSTTLDLAPAAIARALRLVSLPWCWLDAAVPSEELVAASRHFRQTATHDPAVLTQWWRFLVACLVTYGLLPRVLLLAIAMTSFRRARGRVRLDHGDCEALYARLARAVTGWSSEPGVADGASSSVPASGEAVASAPALAALTRQHASCTAVAWGNVPVTDDELAALVRSRFGWAVDTIHAFGGKVVGSQHALLEALTRGRSAGTPVVVAAEAWEAPGKAVRSLLGELRAGAGSGRPIVLALLGPRLERWHPPAAADLALWRRVATVLGDPDLRVEPLVES